MESLLIKGGMPLRGEVTVSGAKNAALPIMAATLLNSPHAIKVSVYVVRAFVELRDFLVSHKTIARRLEEHERKLASHDRAIVSVIETLRQLTAPSEPKRRSIGFVTTDH